MPDAMGIDRTEGPGFRVSDLLSLQRDVLERVGRHAPIGEIMSELCRLVERLVESSICSVLRYEPETRRLALLAAPSAPPGACAQLDGMDASREKGNCAAAVLRRDMVVVADTLHDPLWEDHRDLATEFGIRACWSVPFFSSRGEALGSLGISRTVVGRPTRDQLELLWSAGMLAGIALDFHLTSARSSQQAALLHRIVECSEDPIFAKDLDGRYLIANSAETRVMGEEPADVAGKRDEELFPADAVSLCRSTDQEVLRTGKSVHYEQSFADAENGRRTLLIKKSVLLDSDGRASGVLGISRDVTELRQAEEAMRRAQKLEWLGVLTGGIAHDFNNLLTGILGNAELAQSMMAGDALPHREVGEIQRAAVRAAELIRQMQAYAGMSGHMREVLHMPDILEEVLELLRPSVAKNAELRFDVPDDLPPVEVDATQIRQVVMNLITNASEALDGQAGTVEFAMREVAAAELPRAVRDQLYPSADRFLALRVTDSGSGMDEATKARIFDPFFSTKFEGRGLGLAATLGIVRGHGGAIEVTSRPGEGTSFTVFLPASDAHPPKPIPRPERRAPGTGGGRVLVVDDEPVVRSLAVAILEHAGYDVVAVTDGLQALAELEHARAGFDLVLLDHTMPGLSAAQTFRRLRELRGDLPVVLASGHPEARAREGFDGAGPAGFLRKPYGPSELLGVVREAIERSHRDAAQALA